MKSILNIVLCLLFTTSVSANEDSLIVFSLLEQAKQTESTDSSISYADEAMRYAKKQHYLDGVLTVAKHFGNQYAQTGELEKSINLYREIIVTNSFSPKQLSTAYNQLGIYHVYMGHYDSTEVYFLKALEMRKQLNDSVGMGASLNNLGNVVMSKGDYDRATSYYIQALKVREQIKDSSGIASSTNNLGLIFYKQQKFEDAILYYQKALNINRKQNSLKKEALILLNLGNIYDEMLQLDSALLYYQQAITVGEMSGDLRTIAMGYGNLGVTQQKLENYALAEQNLRKALKIRVESNDIEGQSILYNNLGAVFIGTKKYKEAINYFNQSLEFSKQTGHLETSRDNYLGLSEAYEKLNQYELAFFAHQKFKLIKDSMLNEATNEQIALLNTQYETEKKEIEIASQQLEITSQQLQVKQRDYLLLGLGLLIAFIVLIGGFVYRTQKQKQLRLQEENLLKDEIARINIQNELHQERLQISNSLHDNIGSQLIFIISSVDNMSFVFNDLDVKLKQKLTDITTFTKGTITQLRDTIWALNKDEISFEDLKARLYNYIKNASLAQEQTKFEFNSDLKSDIQLNSIQGVSIYRVVQEAINNAMKYSAATSVLLNISEKKEEIQVSIKDDGIGFNLTEIELGNGLENMRNRALAINATFDMISEPNKGTEILLTLPK